MTTSLPTKKNLISFALIWAAIFAFLSYKFLPCRNFFAILSLTFFSAGLFLPEIFVKLKVFQIWLKFGDFLGRINGAIICLLLFFGIFTPVAFFLRWQKKDLLKKKINQNLESYFTDRAQQPQDMNRQF